jgi:hypothetical protein
MIESEIKCTSLSDSLRRISLFLDISSISLVSYMIIESVSTVLTIFGQTVSLEINNSSSALLNTNDYNMMDSPFE